MLVYQPVVIAVPVTEFCAGQMLSPMHFANVIVKEVQLMQSTCFMYDWVGNSHAQPRDLSKIPHVKSGHLLEKRLSGVRAATLTR